MEDEMDLDLDIDIGGDIEFPAYQETSYKNEEEEGAIQESTRDVYPAPTDGADGRMELDIMPEKVHLRGLDSFKPEDLKQYYAEAFVVEPHKVEWIDDTSANLVYATAELADEALLYFTEPSIESDPRNSDPLHLRQAKPLSTHKDNRLFVRKATSTDVKKKNARVYSRFYLMNPEYDPEERRKQDSSRGRDNRSKKRGRDEEEENVPFDVNLYDDDPNSLAARITHPDPSRSPTRRREGRQYKRARSSMREQDLFANKESGRLRGRSTTPFGDGDGRYGFAEPEIFGTSGAQLQSYQDRDLFEDIDSARSGLRNEELFPNKSSPRKDLELEDSADLFARHTPSSNHRRKDAFDAADDTLDLFADRLSRSQHQRNGNTSRSLEERVGGRSLADRMEGGPDSGTNGRLTSNDRSRNGDRAGPRQGARGSDNADASRRGKGFNIRGSADPATSKPRELFDLIETAKSDDLFASKIKGRRPP